MHINQVNNSVIEDIDLYLYKYLFFHRININNYLSNAKNKFKQQLKCNFLIILHFMSLFRWIIYSILYNNEKYRVMVKGETMYLYGETGETMYFLGETMYSLVMI